MLKQLATTLMCLGGAAAHASGTTATFALSDNYPPLMAADGGIAGAILDEANARLGDAFNIEIEHVPWSRAVALVENGRAHGLVGTYYQPDSRPWIDPYSTPLLDDPVTIFCGPGVADASWTYPQDYEGLTFGILTGSLGAGEELFEMAEAGQLAVEEAPGIEANVRKLTAGRIDCFVEGGFSVRASMAEMGVADQVEIVGDASVEPFYVGFLGAWAQSDPAHMAFIEAFNSVIEEMHADGTIAELVESNL